MVCPLHSGVESLRGKRWGCGCGLVFVCVGGGANEIQQYNNQKTEKNSALKEYLIKLARISHKSDKIRVL